MIIPYYNPDLDGVACAIALAELSRASWVAHVIGDIDDETSVVLEMLGLTRPLPPPKWDVITQIWLVDTHHPNQLPSELPYDRVVHITDHHPGGTPERFLNAIIENEPVGAAATLVAERFIDDRYAISSQIACLLQAAILSNTLDFMAPATSPRDRSIFSRLNNIAPLRPEVISAMVFARQARLGKSTVEIVAGDVKVFDTRHGRIAISQVELHDALSLLKRDDVRASLTALQKSHNADSAVLNLVDLELRESALLSSSHEIIALLGSAIGAPADSRGIIHTQRILQRKSDIIPHLT